MSDMDEESKTRKMRPDEVLAVLNDTIRVARNGDQITESGAIEVLDRDSLISDLAGAYYDLDIDRAEELATPLCQLFGEALSSDNLRPFLTHPEKATVGELCDFIASRADTLQIGKERVLGVSSWEAGLFRAIRTLLERNGADVSRLRPSDLLEPYIVDHAEVFFAQVPRLAPGWMPAISEVEYGPVMGPIRHAAYIAGRWGAVVMASGFLLQGLFKSLWPFFVGFIGMVSWIGGLILWKLVGGVEPKKIQVGEMRTFGDLCRVLAPHYRSTAGSPAPHATAADTPPADEQDQPCREGAVFRRVVDILRSDGADTTDIRPSTNLRPYLLRHKAMFESRIALLAPGVVPPVESRATVFLLRPRRHFLHITFILGVILALIMMIVITRPGGLTYLVMWGSIAATALLITTLWAVIFDFIVGRYLRLGDCETFADLCRLIAGQR